MLLRRSCCCAAAAARVPPRGPAASLLEVLWQHLEEGRDDKTTYCVLGCSAAATELLLRAQLRGSSLNFNEHGEIHAGRLIILRVVSP